MYFNTKPLKIIVAIIFITLAFFFIMSATAPKTTVIKAEAHTEPRAQFYPLTAIVVEADREANIVTFKDGAGNLWAYEGCEDWEVGDYASLLMCDMGTETIYDDTIESIRYAGTFNS